jgi:DNA repair exonuclease SbcCD ATPase subunit
MSFKCVHLSDVHFRGLSRHEEYRQSFKDLFDQVRDLDPDVIFVGGDIVHSKTQGISPELIDILTWWFNSLADLAPTHVILGNHDGLISNKHRQDAITPILTAINNDNIFLYKDSGTYPTGVSGFNWCVFSCFDEENWDFVKPIPGEINIALFHGGVLGSKTDINWDIEGEIEHTFFKDFDFAFLGDIHKMQYLDSEKRIAYPGSTIQQNYGEDPGKGFLFWEIDSKDKFSSTFYEVYHSQPFVTIDWGKTVKKTLENAKNSPFGSRFRIKSDFAIPQAEIKQLHSELKEAYGASEIVFKFDRIDPSKIDSDSNSFKSKNLRDPQHLLSLLKQYYENQKITETEWENIDGLLRKYCNEVSKGDSPRNIKWSLKNVTFENTFSYGKENFINFEKLNGVIGLFGRNRSGKSSIPGTLMYGLFNSSDRGSIKNLHVINTRKGHCSTTIDFTVNGVCYRLERQSVKHQNRRNVVSAVTHANLFEINSEGDVVKDLSGEQRRDTDKMLRNLIGIKEDFLLTSFASQGEMNAFIKQRATQRKAILTNFLDLDIFEKIQNLAKEESYSVKALLDRSPEREWNTLILEKALKLRKAQEERISVEIEISNLQSRLQALNVESATMGFADIVTPGDIQRQESSLEEMRNKHVDLTEMIERFTDKISIFGSKIDKINGIKNQFPIDELREKLESQNDLEKTLLKLERDLDRENERLKNQKKSVKLLEQVPCGDQFPTCKFIKNSHRNKKDMDAQVETISSLRAEVSSARKAFKKLNEEDLTKKINKYQKLLEQESEYKIQISDLRVKLNDCSREHSNLEDNISTSEDELATMKSKVVDEEISGEVDALKQQIADIGKEVKELDAKRLNLSESIGLLTSALQHLESEWKNYKSLLAEWRIYELIMNAVNKKGIPLQILNSELPKINVEISKILQGVVGFTVALEADTNSNAMDIYIDYGDSKRIIECSSGMEKMLSSLAIRVALINISSLPKCDTLIIDEGFGALDEMNVEACNRMLQSLTKWFKNIIVISHVDAVKDAVDNVLEITHKGKDSRVRYE